MSAITEYDRSAESAPRLRTCMDAILIASLHATADVASPSLPGQPVAHSPSVSASFPSLRSLAAAEAAAAPASAAFPFLQRRMHRLNTPRENKRCAISRR